VTVGPGQVVNSIDINVPAPASSSQPNAELLGVTEIGAGGPAFNSGSAINRGSSKKIIIFGRGMSGSLQVSISGPQDITISNVRSISAEDDSPGVAFDVNVSGSAALGARTVILRSANNDITTFTGGLEVVP
jgi:hypothetical protein